LRLVIGVFGFLKPLTKAIGNSSSHLLQYSS
jgi:hypothetical protein